MDTRKIKIRLLLFVLLLQVMGSASATQISIVNLNAAGQGFNENTAAAPVGGNIGTTLGEQRLIVFQYAASIWESIIDSDVEIKIEAQFNNLTCSATSAVLGSAGATTAYRDFTNAPVTNTWYHIALANSLFGSDLDTSIADISATFNSDIDNNNQCLNNTNWYYGIDGNKPANSIDLLTVVIHEIGHGLGFGTFVDISTGAKALGRNDTYMLNLEDHSLNRGWGHPAMSDAQRVSSAIDTGDLHWTGAAVTAMTGNYSAGIDQGHVRNYAPGTLQLGSSVSHFDTAMTPNELMEPIITEPKSGPGLAVQLMADIGWNIFPSFSPTISTLADVSMAGNSEQLSFVIGDNDSNLSTLSFSFAISNPAIIDQSGLSVSGTGVARTLAISNPLAAGTTDITVTVSDGSNVASDTFQLTVTNALPVLNISSPTDNSNVTVDDAVLFQASASDAEDGDLSGNIAWSSDIDGSLGTGSSVSTTLSAGTHTISASVTDSGSLVAIENIILNVFGDSDNDGMNDLWEIQNFGDLSRDGSGDFDNDGITDLDEYLISITVPDGDVNGDQVVDVADLVLMTRHVVGTGSLTALQVARGDVYPVGLPDGVIDLSDLVLLNNQVVNN